MFPCIISNLTESSVVHQVFYNPVDGAITAYKLGIRAMKKKKNTTAKMSEEELTRQLEQVIF